MNIRTKEELARLKEAAETQLKEATKDLFRQIHGKHTQTEKAPSKWEHVLREKINAQ